MGFTFLLYNLHLHGMVGFVLESFPGSHLRDNTLFSVSIAPGDVEKQD